MPPQNRTAEASDIFERLPFEELEKLEDYLGVSSDQWDEKGIPSVAKRGILTAYGLLFMKNGKATIEEARKMTVGDLSKLTDELGLDIDNDDEDDDASKKVAKVATVKKSPSTKSVKKN